MTPAIKRRLGRVRAYFRRLGLAVLGSFPDDWESVEIQVAGQLRGALRDHLELVRDVDNLAFDLLQDLKGLRQPQELFGAHAALLVRVLQDLRVCSAAARSGYTMQAWSVAASCFEAAHTMGFLAASPDRAPGWWAHKDTEHTFCSAKAGVEGSYKYLELGASGTERVRLVDHEYQLYQRLCLAKHINPVAERTRYFTRSEKRQQLRVTPFASGSRVREARLGVLLAVRSAILAVWVFHRCHLRIGANDDPRIATVANRTLVLLETWKDLDK
jgi:hypothetical protein